MVQVKNIVLLFLSFLFFTGLTAQPPKTVNPKAAPVQKFKPPKTTTSLGGRTDSVTVTVDEATQLAGFPLKITDDKKNTYAISSYQFLYRKIGVTEDEQSGKVSPTTSISSDLFRTTPLPELWVKIIREQLKPGEELYFFDVVAKDNLGHFFFAPTLKIKIK